MAISVVMPALEMAQDTGKLVSWRKKSGESVAKGEILLEVETDKAVVEVEALAGGVLGGVTAQPGDVIPVGHTIAWILGPGESAPSVDAGAARPASSSGSSSGSSSSGSSSGSSATAPAAKAAPGADGAPQGGRISPKARRLAKEHNVDIATLRGTGPDGEILAADILAAAGGASAGSSTGTATGAAPAATAGP